MHREIFPVIGKASPEKGRQVPTALWNQHGLSALPAWRQTPSHPPFWATTQEERFKFLLAVNSMLKLEALHKLLLVII